MGKEILTFSDIEIEKNKLYRYKSPIFLKDVDIKKAFVSSKISFGEKICEYILVTCIMIIKFSHYI